MEALAALGVAGNTVQFIDFAAKLCSTSLEIYRDAEGASRANTQKEALLKSFVDSTDEVKSKLGQYHTALGITCKQAGATKDSQIADIASDCQSIAGDLLQRFEKLKPGGKPGKWKSLAASFKCMWNKKELEELQSRLTDMRGELEWHVLLSLRQSVTLLTSRQHDQFEELQSSMIAKLTQVMREQISTLPRWPQAMESTQQKLRSDSMAIANSRFDQPKKSALRKTTVELDPDKDPESFVDEFAALLVGDLAESEEKIWRSLWFPVMDDREDQIAKAELKTFEWILRAPEDKQFPWDNFIDWLAHGGAIYWITGKAGSGKSTLMKYLKNHRQVRETLNSWSDGVPLIVASFFFWYNGNTLQKSQEGLLQSLLYQALEHHRELIPLVFSESTGFSTMSIVTQDYWTLPRLKIAFKNLVEQKEVPLKLCLLVDGLDEYAGDHSEIAEVFRYAANFSHIKVCVSSRPLLPFDRAFKGFPGLMLQNLTFEDIQTYVRNKFNADERFKELEVEEPTLAPDLALQVVRKASGVFLWVKLVVHSLLEGIQNYDRGVDLERRLDDLPEDLDDLYWHILDRVKPAWYLEEGFKLLLLVHAAVVPLTLLQFAFADMNEPAGGTTVKVEDMSLERQNALCKSIAGRIKSRCLGLLEVTDLEYPDEKYRRVQYLHKSVKDFIETPKMMRRMQECLAKNDLLVPETTIIRSLLVELKTLTSRLKPYQMRGGGLKRETFFDEVRPVVFQAVRYGALVESKYPVVQQTFGPFITEIGRLADEFWESVGFRGLEHWAHAPRKPGATPGNGEGDIISANTAQASLQSSPAISNDGYDTDEDGPLEPETLQKGSFLRTPNIPPPTQVRFEVPLTAQDEEDRPKRVWPMEPVRLNLYKIQNIDVGRDSCGFEAIVRGLGLRLYADKEYGPINFQVVTRTAKREQLPVSPETPPQKEKDRDMKPKQSLVQKFGFLQKLKGLNGRRKRK